MDGLEFRAYSYQKIRDILLSIEGVSLDASKKRMSSLQTPDEYIVFLGPQKIRSPQIMVCYSKNRLDVPEGFVYPEVIDGIKIFLKKIGQPQIAAKLSDCLLIIKLQ